MSGPSLAQYVVHVADRQLRVAFDQSRTVAELASEIDRRCARQLHAAIIGRRVVSLHTPAGTQLKGTHVLRDVLVDGGLVYVALTPSPTSGSGSPPAAAGSRAVPATHASREGRPATPTSSSAYLQMMRPSSASRRQPAGGSVSRPSSASGSRAGMGSGTALVRTQSAGRRTPTSHDRPRTPGSADSLSITHMIVVEERAKQRAEEERVKQRAVEGFARPVWGYNPAAERGAPLRAPPVASPGPRHAATDSANTPREHHLVAVSTHDPRAHEARERKRLDADEELSLARSRALERTIPSGAKPASDMTARQVPTAAELSTNARTLNKRERYLHDLLREANAASAGIPPARHQPPVPVWKEKLLERAKVSALAPGRVVPKLYKSVPELVGRPASAGRLRKGRSSAALGASWISSVGSFTARGSPLRESASMGRLLQAQVGKNAFSASSSKYLVNAVRELECALTGEEEDKIQEEGSFKNSFKTQSANADSLRNSPQPEPETGLVNDGAPRSLAFEFAPKQRPATAPRPVVATPAQELSEKERQLFYYTDQVAKQELDAYYLREREERMRAQIGQGEVVEARAVDPRFAHVEDTDDRSLVVAAEQTRNRLFERFGLSEVRINETLAVHAELRLMIKLLRKQRFGLLAQLTRTDFRALSLASDSKHIAQVANAAADDAGKIEAKIERTRNELAFDSEIFAKHLTAMDTQVTDLDSQLLVGIEDADREAEEARQAHWAKLHAHTKRVDGKTNHYGLLLDTHRYLESELSTVCHCVGIKFDNLLQVSTTAEILSSYTARETLNISLWRISDEQTQLRNSLAAEVRALQARSAELEREALLHAEKEERSLDNFKEGIYEDLSVITEELEPTVTKLLEPVGRLFDELKCDDTDRHLPKLTRKTLEEHLHVVDTAVRELQLRAHRLVVHRGGEAGETVKIFAGSLHLPQGARVDSAAMRAAVLQQVARMETLMAPI
mmetsp:Transcript_41799/g.96981  ORF Transcript_41799/g.96981 Transcript_41799/m.96981 type:complete len:968 (+) Transcript_41799:56-2959(+)